MSLFPMFLKLEGRSCLVVGAGKIGESKIRSLLVARAKVRVVAPWATPAVAGWARTGVLTWEAREFEPADLDAIFLVISATSSVAINDLVYREATRRQILCNVVDDPERCDFYYPAVVRRGSSSRSRFPPKERVPHSRKSCAANLKQLAPFYAGWIEQLGRIRSQLFRRSLNPDYRRKLLHDWAAQALLWNLFPEMSLFRRSCMNGKVFLVGAGPGDLDLSNTN